MAFPVAYVDADCGLAPPLRRRTFRPWKKERYASSASAYACAFSSAEGLADAGAVELGGPIVAVRDIDGVPAEPELLEHPDAAATKPKATTALAHRTPTPCPRCHLRTCGTSSPIVASRAPEHRTDHRLHMPSTTTGPPTPPPVTP